MKMSAVVVALCGMVASAWIAQEWQATVTRQREERLDRVAAARTVTISSALRHYENALQAERSLWIASSTVIRSDFEEFAKTLDLEHRYPGLKGIGWRSFVSDRDADRFVARARKDGAPGFAIRPPGRRPNYYVTLYSEPATLFGSTWGFDARATPSILAALEEARDTGRTTMSDQTTLTTDMSLPKERRPVAFELFVPVYEKGAQPTNPTQRRAAFLGWASGQFRADDFLKAASQAAPPGTAVELHDEAVGTAAVWSPPPSRQG
jgi:CHASE1-domain containing sensor protein